MEEDDEGSFDCDCCGCEYPMNQMSYHCEGVCIFCEHDIYGTEEMEGDY